MQKRSLFRDDLLEIRWLRYIQANNRASLKNATERKVVVVDKITLHLWVAYSAISVVFIVVRHMTVPVRLGTVFICRFVKRISQPDRKRVPSFKSLPILTINNLPESASTRMKGSKMWKLQTKNNSHASYAWQGKCRYREDQKYLC